MYCEFATWVGTLDYSELSGIIGSIGRIDTHSRSGATGICATDGVDRGNDREIRCQTRYRDSNAAGLGDPLLGSAAGAWLVERGQRRDLGRRVDQHPSQTRLVDQPAAAVSSRRNVGGG